jgi:chromatin segregation and condensation protein Rec8/ScpA/Scc1 (kleisin family)
MDNRCLGREEKKFREKLEVKKEELSNKLRRYKKLVDAVKELQNKNENDERFMSKLKDAIEKNQLMRAIDDKDHLNKVVEGKLNIYTRKLIQENKEGKRRMKQVIQEAKCNLERIIQEQKEFKDRMGLYGQYF